MVFVSFGNDFDFVLLHSLSEVKLFLVRIQALYVRFGLLVSAKDSPYKLVVCALPYIFIMTLRELPYRLRPMCCWQTPFVLLVNTIRAEAEHQWC